MERAVSPTSERVTVKRLRERGVYDRDAIDAILDEALYCHVAFVVDDAPVVIPTIHARAVDKLYVHGSVASRMLRRLDTGAQVCVSVTLVDGLVVARSAFHHSMNYRSVVVFGRARRVEGDEKIAALETIVEHVVPGRWVDCRPPTHKELRQTLVLGLPITEASAKVRTGPPLDDDDDLVLDHWAGVIPLWTEAGAPVPSPDLSAGIEAPANLSSYSRQQS